MRKLGIITNICTKEENNELEITVFFGNNLKKTYIIDAKKCELKIFEIVIDEKGQLNQFDGAGNLRDIMQLMLELSKQSVDYYKNKGAKRINYIQFYLEDIFQKFLEDPMKALAIFNVIKELQGFAPLQYEEAFLFLAQVDYNIEKWKEYQKQMRFHSYRKALKSNPSIFHLWIDLKNNQRAIKNATENIERLIELQIEKQPLARKKAK